MNAAEVIQGAIREHDRRCNEASRDHDWNQSTERYKQRKAARILKWPPPLDEMIASALREAASGDRVVLVYDQDTITIMGLEQWSTATLDDGIAEMSYTTGTWPDGYPIVRSRAATTFPLYRLVAPKQET